MALHRLSRTSPSSCSLHPTFKIPAPETLEHIERLARESIEARLERGSVVTADAVQDAYVARYKKLGGSLRALREVISNHLVEMAMQDRLAPQDWSTQTTMIMLYWGWQSSEAPAREAGFTTVLNAEIEPSLLVSECRVPAPGSLRQPNSGYVKSPLRGLGSPPQTSTRSPLVQIPLSNAGRGSRFESCSRRSLSQESVWSSVGLPRIA